MAIGPRCSTPLKAKARVRFPLGLPNRRLHLLVFASLRSSSRIANLLASVTSVRLFAMRGATGNRVTSEPTQGGYCSPRLDRMMVGPEPTRKVHPGSSGEPPVLVSGRLTG